MNTRDRTGDGFMDQDSAIRQALEATDRGLFDGDEDLDETEDRAARQVRRESAKPATGRSGK